MKETWIPSRIRIRCGKGNNLLQSSSFRLLLTTWNVEGILIKAMTSTESMDWSPESFLIIAELTWTTWIARSAISSGTSYLSSKSKHSIVGLSCNVSWKLYISLETFPRVRSQKLKHQFFHLSFFAELQLLIACYNFTRKEAKET